MKSEGQWRRWHKLVNMQQIDNVCQHQRLLWWLLVFQLNLGNARVKIANLSLGNTLKADSIGGSRERETKSWEEHRQSSELCPAATFLIAVRRTCFYLAIPESSDLEKLNRGNGNLRKAVSCWMKILYYRKFIEKNLWNL